MKRNTMKRSEMKWRMINEMKWNEMKWIMKNDKWGNEVEIKYKCWILVIAYLDDIDW